MAERETGSHYEQQGYQIFRYALNADAASRTIEAVKGEVFSHQCPLLRYPSGKIEPHKFDGNQISNYLLDPHLAKTLPLTCAALIDLVCSPELWRCLNQLDGQDEYTVHQILLFFTGPGMDIHVDGWFFDTTPQGYAHTVWIPLEDLTADNGPVFVYPTPRGRFIDEAELGLEGLFSAPDDEKLTRYHRYQNAIIGRCRKFQSSVVSPQMSLGDFTVWTSLTPHGSFPARKGTSRLSLQVLVRPTSYDWGRFNDILVIKKPRQEKGDPIRPGWRLFPMT